MAHAERQALQFVRQQAVVLGAEAPMQALRAFRRQRLFEATGLAFIHVPKAAGTSVSAALYGRFIGHFTLRDLRRAQVLAKVSVPVFCLVRNPWDRVVSAWKFAQQGGSSLVSVHPHARRGIQQAGSFERFVQEWLADRDPSTLDGMFRPQTAYVIPGPRSAPVDHLGRVENLAQTVAWIESVLSRRVDIPHINASQREDYRSMYDRETRDIVGQKYAGDVAAFGYDF